jgi:hypothetical protein
MLPNFFPMAPMLHPFRVISNLDSAKELSFYEFDSANKTIHSSQSYFTENRLEKVKKVALWTSILVCNYALSFDKFNYFYLFFGTISSCIKVYYHGQQSEKTNFKICAISLIAGVIFNSRVGIILLNGLQIISIIKTSAEDKQKDNEDKLMTISRIILGLVQIAIFSGATFLPIGILFGISGVITLATVGQIVIDNKNYVDVIGHIALFAIAWQKCFLPNSFSHPIVSRIDPNIMTCGVKP